MDGVTTSGSTACTEAMSAQRWRQMHLRNVRGIYLHDDADV